MTFFAYFNSSKTKNMKTINIVFDTSLFKNENEKKNKHINTDDASEVTTKS